MKKLEIQRGENLRFARADGTEILCPPATRGQVREVLAIDRDENDPGEKRGQQVAIFLGSATWLQSDGITLAGTLPELLDSLSLEEEIDILHAFVAVHNGYEATTAVALQQAMREMLKKKLRPDPQPQ